MSLYLGIDLGTSYFKVGVFDETGRLRGLGRTAVDKTSPALGFYELPVEQFWERLRRGLAEALQQACVSAKDIVVLSYSSQANTFALLDRLIDPTGKAA